MAVFLAARLGELERRDSRHGGGDRALCARGLDQPGHPALECQAVDDDQLRSRERLGVGWRRRIDMRVAIGPDERGDGDPLAADLTDEIAEDREAGDDGELLLR